MIMSSKIAGLLAKLSIGKEFVWIALIILIFAIFLNSYLNQRKNEFFPGLRPLPIIGNIHQMAPHIDHFIPWIGEILDEFGGTTRLWFANRFAVATKDVNLVQIYYTSKQANENFESDLFREKAIYGLGEGLITAAGQKWAFSRKALAPSFTASVLKNFIPTLEKRAEQLIFSINTKLEESDTLTLADEIGLCTYYNIAETFLQLNEDDMENPLDVISNIDTMMHLLQQRGFSPWQNPDAFYHTLPSGKLALKTMNTLRGYLEKIRKKAVKRVEDRQLEGENQWKKKVFINALVQNKGFSDKHVVDELATIISAGSETTASALGFVFLSLGQCQEIQQKVYDEDLRVQQEISGRDLEMSDLSKYSYLELVIKEALRLFPIVPLFYRRLTADLKYEKNVIPVGTELLISMLSIHRDPRYYPDPMVFNPDRFLPENVSQRPTHAYLPFGCGSRICIGQKFSMISMKIIISSMVRNFKIYNDVPLDKTNLKMNVSMKDGDNIKLRLERR